MRYCLWLVTACFLFAASAVFAADLEVPADMNAATLKQWTDKQGAYRRALNSVRGIKSDMARYVRWAKDGPSEKAKSISAPGDMSSALERVARAAEDNAKVPLAIPALDEPFTAMAKAAAELADVAGEAVSYYKRKDYLTDNMARGKELHPKLMDSYNAFVKAADELERKEEVLSDKLEPLELAGIEKQYGREYMWQHMNAMAGARRVVKLLPADARTQVDAKAYNEAVEAFAAAVKDFDAYYAATGEEAVRKQARMSLSPSSFDNFLASARELGQALAEAPKGRSGYGNKVNSVVRSYNSLIGNSNRTTFIVRR